VAIDRRFLGVGWQFPVRVDAHGGLAYASGEQDIQQAIWIILGTARGEREMRLDFGCGMHELVFAPRNAETLSAIAQSVREALRRWEPRVETVDVRVEPDSGDESLVLVHVDYRVRSNNTFHNLVYPFSIAEGAGA
jgi:phage baseplate assembly protein W